MAPINRCVRLAPCLGLAAAIALAAAAATPGLVLAAAPSTRIPVAAGARLPSSASAANGGTSFICPVGGTLTTAHLVPNLRPDPVLGSGADSLLGQPAITTTPAGLPAGEIGISGAAATTGSPASPAPASSFAAGFAATTELYEVPNSSTGGPAPAGSPGAFDASQGAPLAALPSGRFTDAAGAFTGAGLPYAQLFPIVGGAAAFSDPLIPGGVTTRVTYQSYMTDRTAWTIGDQPASQCGAGREYAVLTFSISPYVGHQLVVGEAYAAYLLVRNTSATEPLANHLWYFQAAAPARPPASLTVSVTNDASGTGLYQQIAQARSPGVPVTFKVSVSNTSPVEETIRSISESYRGVSRPACPQDLGLVLSPGAGLVCAVDPGAQSPPAGETVTNAVTVTVSDAGGRGSTATGVSFVSTARAPSTPEVSVAVVAGTAGYGPSEVDPTANAPLPLRVVARNDGAVPEVIKSITESDGLARVRVCTQDFGLDLAVGDSLSCSFQSPEGPPRAGQHRAYTVTVVVAERGKPADTAEGSGVASVTTAPAAPALKVRVRLRNDAGGRGRYLATEEASTPGADVPFLLTITNDGAAVEEITQVSDHHGGVDMPACRSLDGRMLGVGEVLSCGFVLRGYAPGWGQTADNTAAVVVSQPGDPGNTADGADVSSVKTAAAAISVTVEVSAMKVVPGQTVTYTLRVTNSGTAPVRDVQVTDVLSGTAAFVVLDGTGGSTDSFAGRPVERVNKVGVATYRWRYPSLGADGGTAIVVYKVTVLGPGPVPPEPSDSFVVMDTVSVGPSAACAPQGCTASTTSILAAPVGTVGAASTRGPGAPGTGAAMPLLPAGTLILLGGVLIWAGNFSRLSCTTPALAIPRRARCRGDQMEWGGRCSARPRQATAKGPLRLAERLGPRGFTPASGRWGRARAGTGGFGAGIFRPALTKHGPLQRPTGPEWHRGGVATSLAAVRAPPRWCATATAVWLRAGPCVASIHGPGPPPGQFIADIEGMNLAVARRWW